MVLDGMGALIKVGDVEGQAKAALGLLERADLNEMGRRGREHIVKGFSWEMVSKRTSEFYEWVIEDPQNREGWRPGFVRCDRL